MIRYKRIQARDVKIIYPAENTYIVMNLTNRKIVKINTLEQIRAYYGENALVINGINGEVIFKVDKYNIERGERFLIKNTYGRYGEYGCTYNFHLKRVDDNIVQNSSVRLYIANESRINRLISNVVIIGRLLLKGRVSPLLGNNFEIGNNELIRTLHPRVPREITSEELLLAYDKYMRCESDRVTCDALLREVLLSYGIRVPSSTTTNTTNTTNTTREDSNSGGNNLRRDLLHGYHSGPRNIIPHSWESEEVTSTTRYFGVELETEMTGVSEIEYTNLVHNYFNPSGVENALIKMERDSSLTNGCEIIFQPMTIKYIEKNKEFFKEGLKRLENSGATSHDNGRCGLHVHVSRASMSEDGINNLYTMFSVFEKELVIFSRRRSFSYCRFMNFDNLKMQHIPYIDKEYISHNKTTGHGCAINNGNSATIEVRIFRGTLNFRTFMASIELVSNMCEIAMSRSNLNGVTWSDIINRNNYTELKEYNASKHIDGTKVYNELINLKERESSYEY